MNEVLSSLIQSAETARESHIRAAEQVSRSRKHLKNLVDFNEKHLSQKRAEISQNEVQHERMLREFEQLRDMQNSLTMALEFGRADGLGDLAELSGAEIAAGARMGLVALGTAKNDDAPSPDGPSENGFGEKESDRNREGVLTDPNKMHDLSFGQRVAAGKRIGQMRSG